MILKCSRYFVRDVYVKLDGIDPEARVSLSNKLLANPNQRIRRFSLLGSSRRLPRFAIKPLPSTWKDGSDRTVVKSTRN
jgi:hypothetical protein